MRPGGSGVLARALPPADSESGGGAAAGEALVGVGTTLFGVAHDEPGDVGQGDDAPATTPGADGDLVGEHPDALRVSRVGAILRVEHGTGDGLHDRLTPVVVELALRCRADKAVAGLHGRTP